MLRRRRRKSNPTKSVYSYKIFTNWYLWDFPPCYHMKYSTMLIRDLSKNIIFNFCLKVFRWRWKFVNLIGNQMKVSLLVYFLTRKSLTVWHLILKTEWQITYLDLRCFLDDNLELAPVLVGTLPIFDHGFQALCVRIPEQ